MTVLGEAFIEVKADLRPFGRDLSKQLKKATEEIERNVKKSVTDALKDAGSIGDEAGDKLGDGISGGIKRKMGDKRKSPWLVLTASLAAALDDGISALPTEVKAAIVGAIIAASPLISGALAAATSAGIGAGLAGIGTFIAFQYEDVERRGQDLANTLRLQLIDAARPFGPAVLRGLDMIENRFQEWDTLLSDIFSESAQFVEPLTRGLLDAIEGILSGVQEGIGDINGFVDELARGMKFLGNIIGETLRILASTGEEGREAFRDLIFNLGNLLVMLAEFVYVATKVYGVIRDIAQVVGLLNPLLAGYIQQSDAASQKGSSFAFTNVELADSFTGVITLTDEENKKLKELERNLKSASDATYDIVEAQIAFERSLDDIDEALKANGKTLDITQEKGRQNVESFIDALKAAEKETLNQVAIGKLGAQEAATHYQQQIDSVRRLALQAGITNAQFDAMFGEIISVSQLRLDAEAMGITDATGELSAAVDEAARLYAQLQRIKNFRLPAQGTRPFSEYAEGGLVTHPTNALIGEAGPEVVIPLTKPARAAQLMQQSGLAGMLGGAASIVNVYVGNEQLDSRMVRIVENNNSSLGNSLAFGARGL